MTTMTDELVEVADLRARVETLEEHVAQVDDQVRSATGRVDDLEDRYLGGGADTARNRTFPTLQLWVDNVYARLAARHEPVWCTSWMAHDEAVRRLKLLWDNWEIANESDDPRELDSWMLNQFDRHAQMLHSPDGTFRSCKPGQRCDAPPVLGAHRESPAVVHFRPATRGARTS